MAKKEQSDREIEELLNQLKGKTESDAQSTPEVSKKPKKMTDDDVKALLRKYYSDPETLPEETPSRFEFDTSEFVSDEEDIVEEDVIEEDVIEEVVEEDIVEEDIVEEDVTEEDIAEDIVEEDIVEEVTEDVEEDVVEDIAEEDIVEEVIEEKVVEGDVVEDIIEEDIIEEEIAEESIIKEDIVEEELLDEIIYGDIEIDDSNFLFGLDEEIEENNEYAFEKTPVVEVSDDGEYIEGIDGTDVPAETTVSAEMTEEPIQAEPTEEDIIEEESAVEEAAEDNIVEEDIIEELSVEESAEEGLWADESAETVYIDDTPTESWDVQEWKPSEDVSGRLDDGELDLMVALGFGDKLKSKYGEERVRRAEEKQRLREDQEDVDITAYGYIGREYTKQSDVPKINAAFARDRIPLMIRLIGTAIFTVLLFIFGNLGLFGVETSGIFNCSENPTGYALVSLVLLLGAAAFSYRQVIDGVLFSIGRKRSGWVILSVALIVLTVYDILVAIMAPPEAIIYDLPVALGFLIGVYADYMDYNRERATFRLLTENGSELYALYSSGSGDDERNCLTASKIQFADGYFRRTGSPRDFAQLQLLSVIPVAATATLLAVIAAVGGQSMWRACSVFPAVFAFAAPIMWSFAGSWQQLKQTFKLSSSKSGIVGGRISDEYMNADCVIFDDEEAFPTKEVKVQNVHLFDNCDIYETIYNINALFTAVGGPLCEIMRFTAANLGEPKSVSLTGAADHYVEALVDGKNTVCAGSANAFAKRGISVPKNDDDNVEPGCSVMYAAINGEACARFCIKYKTDERFIKTAKNLASDGIGIRLRTLDPNIDRFLLFSAFGESIETSILREPRRDIPKENATVTAVFSRDGVKSAADAFVLGRRVRRLERIINIMRLVMMAVGAVALVLLLFGKCPVIYLSAAAIAIQLIGLLSAIPIYFLGTKQEDKGR